MTIRDFRNRDVLVWLYGIVFFAYILSWPISRSFGVIGYAFLLLAALAAIAGQRGLFNNIPLLFIAPWAALYAILSIWDVMPRAWTGFHENSVIIQQALGYLTLPLFVAANLRLVQLGAKLNKQTFTRLLVLYAFFCFCVAPFLLTSDQSTDIDGGTSVLEFVALNTFFSSELLLVVVLGYVIFCLPSAISIIMAAALLPASVNVQPVLAFIFAILYKFNIIKIRGTLMIMVGLLVICLISTQFVEYLFNLDVNTGIRAAFWQGGLDAFFKTKGVGVGFGSEAIRSSYYFRLNDWLFDQDAADYLLVGMHNSFFNIAFRLGIIGLLLLITSMNKIRPKYVSNNFHNWLFFLAILDLCVNVTIESTSFNLGFSFLMALIIHLNQTASKSLSHPVVSKNFDESPQSGPSSL